MEKDLLQAVIKVEKEIQHSIEAEKRKASDWLKSERLKTEQNLERQKKELLKHYNQSLDEACRLTKDKAETEISEVDRRAGYLEDIPEETIRETLTGHLRSILPEDTGTEQ